ncbi:MAG: hypothetical protein IPJ81_01880 [Chitinophagaceae bacterium]|nr:hypothetical protein [Chitinophagaceae bacterium]
MAKKIKIFNTILLCFCFVNIAISQAIHTSVFINTPYSLSAKNYIQQGSNVTITLTNMGIAASEVRIYPSLEGLSNGIRIKLKPTYASPALFFCPGEIKKITLNQLQAMAGSAPSVNDILFQGYNNKQYFNNGNLPEGLYKLCIDVVTAGPPSLACTFFSITSYDPPIILNPKNNTIITQLNPQNILFNWAPAGIIGKTRYILKLVDLNITPVNNPNDAFMKNMVPFFEQSDIITSTFVYDNTRPNLINGHKYALEITAYDPLNNLLYKNYGHSQVIIFTYKSKEDTSNNIAIMDSLNINY